VLAEKLNDPLERGRVLSFLCYAHLMLGHLEAAIEHGESALALLVDGAAGLEHDLQHVHHVSVIAPRHDPLVRGWAHYWLGLSYGVHGSYRRAAQLLLHSPQAPTAELLRSPAYASYYAWSRSWAAVYLAQLGTFDDAIARGKEAEHAVDVLDRPWERGAANFCLGFVHLRQGRLEQAVARLERCLNIARAADLPQLLLIAAPQLGCTYNLLCRIPESITLLEEAKHLAERTGYSAVVPALVHLGEAYGLAGRTQDATITLNRALDLARERGLRGYEAWALYIAGNVSWPDKLSGAAAAWQSQALALATELEMRPLQAQCHLAIGEVALKSGREADAREHLTTAFEMFREMDMQSWLEKTESALKAL